MKTKLSKRAWSAFLALALIVTAVFSNVTTAKAETQYKDYYATASGAVETATGEEQKYSFEHEKSGDIYMDIYLAAPVDMTLSLYDSTGALVSDSNNPMTVSASDPNWISYEGMYIYQDGWKSMSAGDYSYGVTIASGTQYMLNIYTPVAEPKISETKATITVGFTKKLSVENGTVKSWASSKKSIATVDKNGKVTAKKAGKTTITATLTDGNKVKCTVTVKDNKYSATKITTSDVYYGDTAMSAYSASFDKSGNLVIKARFVNNMSYKVVKLKDIKIVVRDANSKLVGYYKLSSKNVSIPAHSTKDFSFTIKKSSLKKTKADLRNSTVTCEGTSYYVY